MERDVISAVRDFIIREFLNLPFGIISLLVKIAISLTLLLIILRFTYLRFNKNPFLQIIIAFFFLLFFFFLPLELLVFPLKILFPLLFILSLFAIFTLVRPLSYFLAPTRRHQRIIANIIYALIFSAFILQIFMSLK